MHFTTALSTIKDGREIIRGLPLEELVKTRTFLENAVFLIRGTFPAAAELKLLNMVFSAAIDHGVGAPSTTVARIAASTNSTTSNLHAILAAGILTMGDQHGGAIETAARIFLELADQTDDALRSWLSDMKFIKMKVPGFGHRVLATDHRAELLLAQADELGLSGKACRVAERIHKLLNESSSKPLPLNIDGAMAAVLADLGFAPECMKGLFIFARLPGLIAHCVEQVGSGEGVKRLSLDEEIYTGP